MGRRHAEGALGENGQVIKRLALRLTTSPDAGAVARSLLGLLAMTAVALYLGSPAAAMLAAGAGAIAGDSALQETPNQRVSLVVAVSLELGGAVLVSALTAGYSIVFVGVVGLWCFAAGLLWAVGSHAGLVAAAASALLVAVPPATPSPSTVLTLTALTTAAGLAQAALVAVWPPHRWRVQRDALTRAYRTLAADARILADNPHAEVAPASLSWLREAFADGRAVRHPPAYRSAYRLPERISSTLGALRGNDGGEETDEAVLNTLVAGADTLDAIASNSRTARQDGERAGAAGGGRCWRNRAGGFCRTTFFGSDTRNGHATLGESVAASRPACGDRSPGQCAVNCSGRRRSCGTRCGSRPPRRWAPRSRVSAGWDMAIGSP